MKITKQQIEEQERKLAEMKAEFEAQNKPKYQDGDKVWIQGIIDNEKDSDGNYVVEFSIENGRTAWLAFAESEIFHKHDPILDIDGIEVQIGDLVYFSDVLTGLVGVAHKLEDHSIRNNLPYYVNGDSWKYIKKA